MRTSTLAQMAVLKARVSLPSRLRKTLATPSLNSMATTGKVEHSKSVRIALPALDLVALLVAEASEVVMELVEGSAAVVALVDAVDSAAATAAVGEEVTAVVGMVDLLLVATMLPPHPLPRIRSQITPLLVVSVAQPSTSAM